MFSNEMDFDEERDKWLLEKAALEEEGRRKDERIKELEGKVERLLGRIEDLEDMGMVSKKRRI